MRIKLLGQFLVVMGAALCFQGCMSAAKQTKQFYAEQNVAPRQVLLKDVPFIAQAIGHCGPATLSMVLSYQGRLTPEQTIAAKIFNSEKKGTLPADMIMAARSEMMFAVPIYGLTSLLQEVEVGHPVIVFENLGIRLWPQWHYAVVIGFDTKLRTVTLHTGPDSFKTESMAVFELSWSLGNYWGLVIIPPGQLSPTATEVDQITAAVALENLGFLDAAEISYKALINRWPQSYVAVLGLGQIAFQKKKYKEAVHFFERAVAAKPDSTVAQTNYKIAKSVLAQKKN